MTQLWAIFNPAGAMTLRYTHSLADHPSAVGHAAECLGCVVHALSREPELVWGEQVNPATGQITYVGGAALEHLVQTVKDKAWEAIELIAPDWRQLNDLRQPSAAGSLRFTQIDTIRTASNVKEGQLRLATSAASLKVAYA